MGGKSSSSSSQSTTTQQLDKRIGATDNAVVLTAENGTVTYNAIDAGAIEAAKEVALQAISGVLSGAEKAISANNTANEKAYQFADAARVQENEKNYKTTVQWVAIVAIAGLAAWGYRYAK